MNVVTEKFKSYFSDLSQSNTFDLSDIYSKDIVFKDPIHEIRGLENLKLYFVNLNKNLDKGSFKFIDEKHIGNQVFLEWEMTIKLKRPKKTIQASGVTILHLNEKIVSHRDYFDAGELFYENIPLLGSVIKWIKRKIAQ